MELIKRKILLENSVDRNNHSPTYGTLTATTFFLNVFLTQSGDDMGVFTDLPFIPQSSNSTVDYSELTAKLNASGYTFPFMTGGTPSVVASRSEHSLRLTGLTEANYYSTGNTIVSGVTDSKLEDVRNYNTTNPYQVGFNTDKEVYINAQGQSIVGVDRVTQVGSATTYVTGVDELDPFIGTIGQGSGLLYEEFTGLTRTSAIGEDITYTTVKYKSQGWNATNTSLSALTKYEYLLGIISPPEIKSDIFIDRGITSVLDQHLRLSEIRNLSELERYGNGFYKLNKV